MMKKFRTFAMIILAAAMLSACGGGTGFAPSSGDGPGAIQGRVSITGMSDASNVLVTAELNSSGRAASVNRSIEEGTVVSRSTAAGDGIYAAFTGPDGKFSLNGLPEGTYTVTAEKEHTLGAVVQNVFVGETQSRSTVTLDIVLTATGSISGTASLEDTSSAYGTFIYAAGTSYVAAAAENGNFTISNIPVGIYTIVYYHAGYVTQTEAMVVVEAAQTGSLTGAVLVRESGSERPFVVYTSPTANEVDVQRDAAVSIVFNTEMDETTINNSTVALADSAGAPVNGTFSFSENTVTFVPDQVLNRLEKYSFTISALVENAAGIAMGYVFMGYFTIENGYIVTYDGNGSIAGSVPALTWHSVSSTVTVPGNTGALEKPPSNFLGWCESPEGIGTTYSEGQSFTINSDVVLYAQWSPVYSVTYNGNGHTAGTVPETGFYIEGGTVTVPGNPGSLEKNSGLFLGWSENADGSGNVYAEGQTFTISITNVVLYARWGFTVTFYKNDINASGTMTPQVIAEGQSAALSLCGFTNGDLLFDGWAETAEGDAVYNNGGTFTMGSSNVELFAKWVEDPFLVPAAPGEQVTVTAGGVAFKMNYANNQTSITFPFSPNFGTPVDTVKEAITHKFFMGETEVTWAVWKAVYDWAVHADRGANVYAFSGTGRMGSVDGGAGMTNLHPVTMVSWRDAIIWCNALSEMTGAEVVYVANGTNGTTDGAVLRSSVTGAYGGQNVENVVKSEDDNLTRKGYRLPTSKEWEYAARYVGTDAGGRTDYVSQGVNSGHADLTAGYYWTPAAYASGGTGPRTGTNATDYPHFNPFAWYGNSITEPNGNTTTTQPVGLKTKNALDLYDMSGNVWEWCFTTPDGSYRVIRGGGWSSSAYGLQVGGWYRNYPVYRSSGIGFRFSRTQ